MVCPEDGAAANTGTLILSSATASLPFTKKHCTMSDTRKKKKRIYLINQQHINKRREVVTALIYLVIKYIKTVNITDFTRTAIFYCLINK